MTRYTRRDYFVRQDGERVDLNALRRAYLKLRRQVGNPSPDGRVNHTELWRWIAASGWGKLEILLPGQVVLWSLPHKQSPWAERLKELKPRHEKPRVHLSGTKGDLGNIPENPLELPLIRTLIEKHGLQNPIWSYSATAEGFWAGFYDCENYIEEADHVPSLMIATGSLRDYLANGSGMTIDVGKHLKYEIADSWGIPIELVPFFRG